MNEMLSDYSLKWEEEKMYLCSCCWMQVYLWSFSSMYHLPLLDVLPLCEKEGENLEDGTILKIVYFFIILVIECIAVIPLSYPYAFCQRKHSQV